MSKKNKSLFRRISNWLHLWLGLFSGIVVSVVCLTAAIWVFRDEMTDAFTPGQNILEQQMEFLKPSKLTEAGKAYIDSIQQNHSAVIYKLEYRTRDKSSVIGYFGEKEGAYQELFINPYSASVLYNRTTETGIASFNNFLRSGHRFFWLPRPFGSYFVGSCCIIFLITLITGLIWWYPSKWNKSTFNKSFKIKWCAKWKRVNIDLHNVLGFYTFIFIIILTVTGIVFTFKWFDNGYHWLITGGSPKVEHQKKSLSDTTIVQSRYLHPEDQLWKLFKSKDQIRIMYPQNRKDVYTVYIHPTTGHNDLTKWYAFDQKTLRKVGEMDSSKLSFGTKVYKANFDIHVGTIGGMTTKIIAALASLVGASLPITGFIIWYNRKWSKKTKKL